MTDAAPSRPVPRPDDLTAPFWAAAAEHRLVLPRCGACGRFSLPPDLVCGECASTDPRWAWEEASGRGVLRSWTIARQVFLPGFDEPPVIIDVELAEQADLRIISRLVDPPDTELTTGVALSVAFDDVGPGVALPVFRVAGTP